jgi:hypothetical protein
VKLALFPQAVVIAAGLALNIHVLIMGISRRISWTPGISDDLHHVRHHRRIFVAPLAGMLIEYFVVGAVAGLWLGPVVVNAVLALPSVPKELYGGIAVSLVPAFYLAGMICDLLGYKLLHDRKSEIETTVRRKAKLSDFSAQRVHALAVSYEPALAKEIESRSTRDRIARGSLIASIPLLWLSPFEGYGKMVATTIAVFMVVALYLLWHRMQTLSAKYEIQVATILKEKHNVRVAEAVSGDV